MEKETEQRGRPGACRLADPHHQVRKKQEKVVLQSSAARYVQNEPKKDAEGEGQR